MSRIVSMETRQKMSESLKGRIPWNKGIPCSAETKRKLSETNKGFKHTEEAKEKIRLASLGRGKGRKKSHEEIEKMVATKKAQNRKHSEEFKEMLSEKNSGKNNPFYGRKHTNETKRKIAVKLSGPNCLFWKGGIAYEPYCDTWGDKDFKEDIKERDNHQCKNPDCWGTSDKLCIHHINYIKKNCHPDNLITLCISCNARANQDRDYWESLYSSLIRQKTFNMPEVFNRIPFEISVQQINYRKEVIAHE